MCLWDCNIKMDIKGTSFVFRLNSSLQHEQRRIFGKANEVILHKNYKNSKIFQLNLSVDGLRTAIFLD